MWHNIKVLQAFVFLQCGNLTLVIHRKYKKLHNPGHGKGQYLTGLKQTLLFRIRDATSQDCLKLVPI